MSGSWSLSSTTSASLQRLRAARPRSTARVLIPSSCSAHVSSSRQLKSSSTSRTCTLHPFGICDTAHVRYVFAPVLWRYKVIWAVRKVRSVAAWRPAACRPAACRPAAWRPARSPPLSLLRMSVRFGIPRGCAAAGGGHGGEDDGQRGESSGALKRGGLAVGGRDGDEDGEAHRPADLLHGLVHPRCRAGLAAVDAAQDRGAHRHVGDAGADAEQQE